MSEGYLFKWQLVLPKHWDNFTCMWNNTTQIFRDLRVPKVQLLYLGAVEHRVHVEATDGHGHKGKTETKTLSQVSCFSAFSHDTVEKDSMPNSMPNSIPDL